jgi:hypothetical protein
MMASLYESSDLRAALDRLREMLGQEADLSSETIIKLRTVPVIYAWTRTIEILYVGMSSRGMARAMDPLHHAVHHRLRGTECLHVWPQPSEREARHWEARVIREMQPAWNTMHRAPQPEEAIDYLLSCHIARATRLRR